MRALYQAAGGSIIALADDRNECYVVQLVGKVGKKNYHTALRGVLKNLPEDAYTNFLLNTKDLQSRPDLAGYWFWAHFVPRYYKQVGKCKIAIVRAKQTFWHNQLGKVSGLLKIARMDVEVKFFDELNTGQDWLIEGILPAQTTLKEAIQKRLPSIPNPFKRKKTEEEEEEDNDDAWSDEPPEEKKKNFLLRAFHSIRERLSRMPFFKDVKVIIKFDPKGRLQDDD